MQLAWQDLAMFVAAGRSLVLPQGGPLLAGPDSAGLVAETLHASGAARRLRASGVLPGPRGTVRRRIPKGIRSTALQASQQATNTRPRHAPGCHLITTLLILLTAT